MAYYSLEDAIARLPELLAKATEGEEVIITRLDEDLIQLVPAEPRPMTKEEIDWLRANRVTLSEPVDFTALVREMRDEGV
ncbi:type II toxin-antitoxin system Phd/YefM family antitoxin [Methylobacterium oryzihabitans]|uniref:Type II toxin-antitoxin system Phd/YefM family antitoxin n=1 Tax=Methylobacterium oryzihabitans TaxID=2499852 RepID=A0A3S3U6Q7_9HYPH|nr:type II toxin-antitoxin system Phd/YefM family antitoxin [Methylobacterium oryzihabitans]RVU16827.1 type II toxin-antitoxin system Phd/YefM family antitoxin [Methylobacterium oryzihabitans]